MAFHNTRENESGLDLNREIDEDKVELVAGVKIFLRDRRFDFSIYFFFAWIYLKNYFNPILEVIDPSTISPLDYGTIYESIKKTNIQGPNLYEYSRIKTF